ncbi:aluminum-activated malate transporter 2-like [Primulina huaijiensis]|uniref:aluminum-activated malate transporter 2-like n=1 Tax=Primulina huaijiensis TaxID=1492673 RepID=UPI003CC71478
MHATMEMEPGNKKNPSFFQIGLLWIKGFSGKPSVQIEIFLAKAKEMANEDPRKVIHSMKVGLTITLVSLFCYFQPFYSKDFEVLSSMWTLMTVVAVFEFSVGATLGKILNRGLGTLIACGLGVAAHHLADFTGKTYEPITIGTLVFIQAVATTYARFFPEVKARYDYGATIFMATFCLVSVSGFEKDEMVKWVQDRLVSVVIGATICVMVSIIVFPVWAGEDLHRLVARDMENLGNFMEDFEAKCFPTSTEGDTTNEESLYSGLSNVLDSKTNLETLDTQKVRATFQEACSFLYLECGKALKELAWSIDAMTKSPSPNHHVTNLIIASENMKYLLKSDFCEGWTNSPQMILIVGVASLLTDIVSSVKTIDEAVSKLGSLATFEGKGINENSHMKDCECLKHGHEIPHYVVSINSKQEG